ncbi:MAG TPA: toprim domain-containing protein, partial [Ruminiclostridium sp.]|nr:toprim domain-containing protein [Ruminiclostridium sp.]
IKNIVVCTDNDEVGNEAARNFMKVYDGKGYTVSRESPYEKDFNEDLVKSMHRSRSMARAI